MSAHKAGDRVVVTFPAEPAVAFAGTMVSGFVDRVRDADAFKEYPYVVAWRHEGRELLRFCAPAWVRTASIGERFAVGMRAAP